MPLLDEGCYTMLGAELCIHSAQWSPSDSHCAWLETALRAACISSQVKNADLGNNLLVLVPLIVTTLLETSARLARLLVQ